MRKAAEEYNMPLKKFIVCQKMGTKDRKILYRSIEEFRGYDGVQLPYCIILPSKMHFVEKDVVESFSKIKK